MKWPQHKTPSNAARRARAPYNFVPLPEAILEWRPFREHHLLDPDRHHGSIELTITTETELYTRCAYPVKEEVHDPRDSEARQQFYHHGNPEIPVIPGSSLRGMVRSLVEILSYSRITRRPGRMRDKRLVYRAVADQKTSVGQRYGALFQPRRGGSRELDYPAPNVKAGYLEPSRSGGWQVRPAQVQPATNGSSLVRVPIGQVPAGVRCNMNAHSVWVRPEPIARHPSGSARGVTLWYARTERIQETPAPGLVAGTLVCTGETPRRHMHTVVYAADVTAKPFAIDPETWSLYVDDRDMHRGLPARRITGAGDPLFYLLDSSGRLLFLGPTPFFRIPYAGATGDFVPESTLGHENAPLDLAEALFGTVNGERRKPNDLTDPTGSHRGRVFFEEAPFFSAPDAEGAFLDPRGAGPRWPSILSSPKPTSYQNYLVQTDVRGDPSKLLSYDDKPGETVLRGFKQYWHRGSAANDLSTEEPQKDRDQRTAIRPVRPRVVFKGRVRFENLDLIELGALLTALELPATCRHHLGMGKPLGMGSVHIGARTTLIDPVRRYGSLEETGVLTGSGATAEEAKRQFAETVMQHHNRSVRAPRVSSGSLWDIPRLGQLRVLLEWVRKPPRPETAYLPDPARFRDRQVLPTPSAVSGGEDPSVDAEVLSAGTVARSGTAALESTESPATPPHAPPRETRTGAIVRFSQSTVRLRLEGEPTDRDVRLDIRIFPVEHWEKLTGGTLRHGRRVRVEVEENRVVRVVPDQGGT